MSWPIGELDPFRPSLRMQVTRVVFAIGVKALLDDKLGREAARERDRRPLLDDLARKLREGERRGRRIASFGERPLRAGGSQEI
jgi:hypothetical protein